MVVNLRGTSGSGKSHLIRRIMGQYLEVTPVFMPGRTRPWRYECAPGPGRRRLWVLGHYETPCGGCDTYAMRGALDVVYAEVRAGCASGADVLYEGLIVESDVRRLVALSSETPVMVLVLDVTLEECIRSTQQRRADRGDARPFNAFNTSARVPQIKRRAERLREAGVDVRWLGREAAFRTAAVAFGVGTEAMAWTPLARPTQSAQLGLFS